MKRTYKVELELGLTDEQQRQVVETTRHSYSTNPATAQEEDGVTNDIPAEEFVDGPVAALMEIVRQNQLLADLGIQVDGVSCTNSDETAFREDLEDEQPKFELEEVEEDDFGDDDTNELDDWEGGLYLCRWPNGEFSVVKADSKLDAMIQLDEWAGANASWLVPLETFIVDFALNELGQIEMAEFGEHTAEFLREHCYPELEAVLSRDDVHANR